MRRTLFYIFCAAFTLFMLSFSATKQSAQVESRLLQTSLPVTPLTSVEAQSSCSCADKSALYSRRHEVIAAIAAIDKQIMQLEADERKLGKVIPYSDNDYKLYISNWVQMAIEAAHDKSAPQVHGPTKFTSDCTPSTNASDNPSCFWQGLVLNEAERQKFCEGEKRGGADAIGQVLGGDKLGGLAGTWMGRYPIENFAQAEKRGYQAELAYIDTQIENLSGKCLTGQWTGQVIVTYSSQTKINESPKPDASQGPHKNYRTEEVTTNETEQAVIALINGYALASGTADYSKQDESHFGPETWCHASTQKNAIVPWSRTAITFYQISGPVYNGARVSVSFNNDGTYTISVRLPEGVGSGTSNVDNSETGECAQKPLRVSSPVANKPVGGFNVKGKGRGKQTDLTLDGSDSPKPLVSPPNTETKITMEWHLARSQAK